jgi:DNA-binding response OmpR family regulator
MARILHLEDDEKVRKRFAEIVELDGHEVEGFDKVPDIEDVPNYDLYVCNQMGRHSDGLSLAAELAGKGKKVLILSDRRKFSRIPFYSTHGLKNSDRVRLVIREMVTGG